MCPLLNSPAPTFFTICSKALIFHIRFQNWRSIDHAIWEKLFHQKWENSILNILLLLSLLLDANESLDSAYNYKIFMKKLKVQFNVKKTPRAAKIVTSDETNNRWGQIITDSKHSFRHKVLLLENSKIFLPKLKRMATQTIVRINQKWMFEVYTKDGTNGTECNYQITSIPPSCKGLRIHDGKSFSVTQTGRVEHSRGVKNRVTWHQTGPTNSRMGCKYML